MKRDFNILNYFNMRALFLGVGTAKILITAKEYFLISLLLGTLLGVGLLFLFRVELKNKIISTIVASILFIIAIILLIHMISTMYLTEMPKLLIGIPIVLLVLYIISKKEIVLYRVSTILVVINTILFALTFISLIRYVKWSNFSYTDTSFMKVLFAGVQYAIFSTVPTFITRDKEISDYSLIKTYVISSFTMGVIFFLTFGILGPELINQYRYPEYIILKKVTFLETLANLENIISFVWVFDILMLLVSCANTIKKCINHNKITYLFLIGILIFVSFISKFYQSILYVYDYTLYILISVFLLLYLFNRKKNHKHLKKENLQA